MHRNRSRKSNSAKKLSLIKRFSPQSASNRKFPRSLWRVLDFNLPFALSLSVVGCTCSGPPTEVTINSQILAISQSFTLEPSSVQADLEFFSQEPHPLGTLRQKDLAIFITQRVSGVRTSTQTINFSVDTPNPILLKSPDSPAPLTIKKMGRNILALPFEKDLPASNSTVLNGLITDATSSRDIPHTKISSTPTKVGARAFLPPTESGRCLVLVSSHYDTKIIEGFDYLGANDSGSSSILNIYLQQYLSKITSTFDLQCMIGFIWFDGEEAILPGWSDGEQRHPAKIQDNTYGSRSFANSLVKCKFNKNDAWCVPSHTKLHPLISLINIDMVGSNNIKISLDSLSSPAQLELLAEANHHFGNKNTLSNRSIPIKDDHIPFRKKQISAIDIIDFNHLAVWHKQNDVAAAISHESLNFAGKLAIFMALTNANNPQAFFETTDK